MADEERKMTSRVPVAADTHSRLQEFAQGLGATFDGAINFLLDRVIDKQEGFVAGKELRPKYKEVVTPNKNKKG